MPVNDGASSFNTTYTIFNPPAVQWAAKVIAKSANGSANSVCDSLISRANASSDRLGGEVEGMDVIVSAAKVRYCSGSVNEGCR